MNTAGLIWLASIVGASVAAAGGAMLGGWFEVIGGLALADCVFMVFVGMLVIHRYDLMEANLTLGEPQHD